MADRTIISYQLKGCSGLVSFSEGEASSRGMTLKAQVADFIARIERNGGTARQHIVKESI